MAGFGGHKDVVAGIHLFRVILAGTPLDVRTRLVGAASVHPKEQPHRLGRVIVFRNVEIEGMIFVSCQQLRHHKGVAMDELSFDFGVLGAALGSDRIHDRINILLVAPQRRFERRTLFRLGRQPGTCRIGSLSNRVIVPAIRRRRPSGRCGEKEAIN